MPEPLVVYSAVVASAAALGTIANASWNVHVGRRDRAQVRVSVRQGRVFSADQRIEVGDLAVITAVNVGRRPTEISHFEVKFAGKAWGMLPLPQQFPRLPMELKPDAGSKFQCVFPMHYLQERLDEDINGRVRGFAFVATGGRRFRSMIPRWSEAHDLLRQPYRPLPANLSNLGSLLVAGGMTVSAPLFRGEGRLLPRTLRRIRAKFA